MRHLLKALGRVGIAAMLIYGLAWLVAGFWTPSRAPISIDSEDGRFDYYRTPIREFVYRLPAFCADATTKRKNLFIIGGSSASAYRPNLIEPELPGWTVSNISLEFSNITQIKQTFELVRSCLDPEVLKNSRFVLGINYALLGPNELRWPARYTMLELDMLRHGLFAGSPGAVDLVYSWPHTRILIAAMRPIFLTYALSFDAWQWITSAASHLGGYLIDQSPEALRERQYQVLLMYMGPFEPDAMDEQVHELETLEAEVRAAGSDIIFLDIPVEHWLDNRLPHQAWYRSWVLDHTRDRGVPYLAPSPVADLNDFADLGHANPSGAVRWSKEAAARLGSILRSGSQSTHPPAKIP